MLITFTFGYKTYSQDPVLSQFYSAPLLLNPAFAGNTSSPRIALNYRNQWPAISQAYRTYAVSYDQFFEAFNSGLGASILTDDAGHGIYKTTKVAGIYSYRLKVGKNSFIKTGLELGGVLASVGWDKLIFPDQLDPLYGDVSPGGSPIPSNEIRPDKTNRAYLDLAMGTMFYNPHFYGGLSLNHINNPDVRFTRIIDGTSSGLPIRLTLHAGSQISITDARPGKSNIFVSPNILYTKQNNFSELLAGAYIGLGPLFTGLWGRLTPHNLDAAIINVGVRVKNMKISYSFDSTISSLTIRSGGAHELGIVINLDDQSLKKTVDYNDCFQLFR
ncbi:MAG: PorP/SprF family type IX secretion system membrane protein [Saprospiraceae bacterium]